MTRAQARLLRKVFTAGGPIVVAIAALAVLMTIYMIFDRLLDASVGGSIPREIAIPVRNGEAVDFGRRELLQPVGPSAAVDRHVRLSRGANGQWQLASPTGQRRALLQFTDGTTTFAHRWPLATGDEVRLQGAVIRFTSVDHARRVIALDVRTATGARQLTLDASHFNRGTLTSASPGTEPGWVGSCQPRGVALEVLLGLRHLATGYVEGWRWAERLLRRFQDKPRLLIGGVLTCRGGYDVPRLAMPGLEARELILVERGGRFMLAPGVTQPALVIRRGPCRVQGFQEIAWRIDGSPASAQDCAVSAGGGARLASIVLGRTRYDVSLGPDRAMLRPTLNVPLLSDTEAQALEEERRNAGITSPMPELQRLPNRQRWIGIGDALKQAGAFDWRGQAVLVLPFVLMGGLLLLRRLPVWQIARGSEPLTRGSARQTIALVTLWLSLLLTAISTVLLSGLVPAEVGEVSPKAMFAVVLANYALASIAVAMETRTGPSLALLWLAVLVLMGTGLLNMAQLGFGADSTRFVELYTGQLQVYGLLPPLIVAVASVRLGLVRQAAAPLFASERARTRAGFSFLESTPASPSVLAIARQIGQALLAAVWFFILALLALLIVGLLVTALINGLGASVMLLDEETSPLQYAGFAVVALLVLFLVYRLPTIAFSMKAAPLLILTLMFLAWLALGGDTGLGPFQPVELGKFAAVAFLSLFLIALDRRQSSRDPVVPLSLFLIYGSAVVFFIFLFAVVPALKSDFSPVLIVTLTSLSLVAIAGFRPALRVLVGNAGSARWQRMRDAKWMAVPTHLKPFKGQLIEVPGVRRRLSLGLIAGVFRGVVALALIGAGTFVVRDVLSPFFWDDYVQARERLETLLAVDDVGKLAQRALSYRDLDYSRPGVPDEAGNLRRIVDYRDLGLQVIQSRQAIAAAPCHDLATLTGDPRRFLMLRMLLGRADPPAAASPPRRPAVPAPTTATVAATPVLPTGQFLGAECRGDAGAVFGRNPESVQRIPAVKDDFAAAFFMNRFGLKAAVALGIAQLILLLVLVTGAFRVRRALTGDHRETAFRFALFGTMLGGAILFGLHWAISWSNQFGLLPVMGQPMTFLSLGGSHLTLMAFPLIVVAILGLRIMAEPATRRPHFSPPDPPRRGVMR